VRNIAQQPRQVGLWERNGDGEPTAVKASVYDRNGLPLDFQLEGPAIVIEEDATTYIPSGWVAHTEKGGYLRIRKNG
jgi:N-methylhydantoinase A/oxoprolinase/acetone carboxylase beta subunit